MLHFEEKGGKSGEIPVRQLLGAGAGDARTVLQAASGKVIFASSIPSGC
jgi:hypothetical protein